MDQQAGAAAKQLVAAAQVLLDAVNAVNNNSLATYDVFLAIASAIADIHPSKSALL